ncbi:chorion protein S19 [Drosophila hydei]|uniref:Chorion protein S19 n=1 Tax=Drosophila hydei TaxID=7224 RepID=A0A6J1LR10_DROHY|nr:chorion protein S19 [Drosophila hydei]
MNKFATLAVFFCAYLAVGSCNYGGSNYGGHRSISNYAQRSEGGAAAASSAAAVGGNDQRPVEIIAGPRYGGSEQLRPILIDSGYGHGGHSGYGHGRGHGNIGHIGHIGGLDGLGGIGGLGGYGGLIGGGNYGGHQRSYNNRPRYSVQPAGATLLYPGRNNYRRIVSPVEYSKVVLPVRAAPPVAKLYLPENNYGSYGNEGLKY